MYSLVPQAGFNELSRSSSFSDEVSSGKIFLSELLEGGGLCMAKQRRKSSTKRTALRKVEVKVPVTHADFKVRNPRGHKTHEHMIKQKNLYKTRG